jgi:predicted HicB family RNase H-like nuclease
MDQNLEATIHIRVPVALHEQLALLAAKEERPLSSLVRRMLRAEAARHAAQSEQAA